MKNIIFQKILIESKRMYIYRYRVLAQDYIYYYSYYHKILFRWAGLNYVLRIYISHGSETRLMQSKEYFPGTSMRATTACAKGYHQRGDKD